MVGTLLGFGWCVVGSWLAECCFMVGGLCWANAYPTSKVTLAQPDRLLLGQHYTNGWVLVGEWLAC